MLRSLLFILTASLAVAADYTVNERFEKQVQAYEDADRANPPPKGAILLAGDSQFFRWKTLSADLPKYTVINRGIDSFQLHDLLHYADRLVLPHQPRLIVLHVGGNDIHTGKTPERLRADFQAFVALVRAKLPGVPVIFSSLTPGPGRWDEAPQRRDANRVIREYVATQPGLIFVNLWDAMLTPDGQPREDLWVEDRVHPNHAGYLIRVALTRPLLGSPDKPSPSGAVLPNVTFQPSEVLPLWPGAAPGEAGPRGTEHVLPDRPRPFDQITDVSVPTLAVFQPTPEQRTGTAMLVIPGGGLERLAIEHEGYEVAEWLVEHGITAFLLKYRVPPHDPAQRWKVGLQDAQRAMGLIRLNAAQWNVDAEAIGSIGFSAGAEINVMLSTYHGEPRQYPRVDAADDLTTRPAFNIALYGGGFSDPRAGTMRADIATRLGPGTPPMFIAHAFDDQALNSTILLSALKRANVASELHIFAAGGHGFGIRDSGLPLGRWGELCLNWLRWQGFLDAPALRVYAREFAAARDGGSATLPHFTKQVTNATVTDAFAVQHRLVHGSLARGDAVAGYKAAFPQASAQAAMKLTGPLHGVLLRSGRIEATPAATVALDPKRPLLVETEIGFVIATDIGGKLRVPRQALTAVEALVPVIELPVNVGQLMGNGATAADLVAGNVGSDRYIVGTPVAPAIVGDVDALAVSLQRDGKILHQSTGADVNGGQARHLMTLINQIIDQGHVLRKGDIIICGALGGAKPAAKGNYIADYGPLGRIEFKLE